MGPPGGMPPEMGMGGPPGPPPADMGMGPQPDAAMAGPMNGGGIPPVMQGQLEPEMLGLPPGVDPLVFQQLVQQGIPEGEIIRMLMESGGVPPAV